MKAREATIEELQSVIADRDEQMEPQMKAREAHCLELQSVSILEISEFNRISIDNNRSTD